MFFMMEKQKQKMTEKNVIFDIFMPISVDLCEWKNFKAFFHLYFFITKEEKNRTSYVEQGLLHPKHYTVDDI